MVTAVEENPFLPSGSRFYHCWFCIAECQALFAEDLVHLHGHTTPAQSASMNVVLGKPMSEFPKLPVGLLCCHY